MCDKIKMLNSTPIINNTRVAWVKQNNVKIKTTAYSIVITTVKEGTGNLQNTVHCEDKISIEREYFCNTGPVCHFSLDNWMDLILGFVSIMIGQILNGDTLLPWEKAFSDLAIDRNHPT